MMTQSFISSPERSRMGQVQKRLVVPIGLLLVIISVVQTVTVRDSSATPNWSRKYNADCAMCHYPLPPRLNSFGLQFRWAGYRTPAEFNKDQDGTKVGDFLAARVTTQLAYQNNKGQLERTEFLLNDATLFYAGAVSRNFSALFRPSYSSDGAVNVGGQIQGVFGNEHQFFSFRTGQMSTLEFVGVGGLDRPTGASLPPIYSSALTNTLTSGGVPFNMVGAQKGIELAYAYGPGRLKGLVLNGVESSGFGTSRRVDIDADKDYVVAYEHILDNIASAFTVFYYKGVTHGTVGLNSTGIPISATRRFDFSLLGVNINKVIPVGAWGYFELLGGYTRSYHNAPAPSSDTEGNAFYVEAQQVFVGPELAFYERFSLIDQDAARNNTNRKVYTFGAATRIQTWSRLAVEYSYTDNRDREINAASGHSALVEFFVAF